MSVFVAICVEVDVNIINIPPHAPSWNLLIHDSYLKTESASKAGFISVPFSSLLLDIGHPEKSFSESIM